MTLQLKILIPAPITVESIFSKHREGGPKMALPDLFQTGPDHLYLAREQIKGWVTRMQGKIQGGPSHEATIENEYYSRIVGILT